VGLHSYAQLTRCKTLVCCPMLQIQPSPCRLPYGTKTEPPIEVQDVSSSPDSPDIEVAWFPLLIRSFDKPTLPGEYGISLVSVYFVRLCASLICILQGVIALMPESSGSVTLKTGNPYDKPLVDLKYVYICRLVLEISKRWQLLAARLPRRSTSM
jgi:hypothetical protein